MNFHGVNVAVLVNDKILLQHRDKKVGLFNSNKWAFPGGAREGNETDIECGIREIKEEFGINLNEQDLIWKHNFPSQKDSTQSGVFLVFKPNNFDVNEIQFKEGQAWEIINEEEFFNKKDLIPIAKYWYRTFLLNYQRSSNDTNNK